MSIVGFDDTPEAAHFSPPLTTIRQDFTELGQRMMLTVSDVLEGREITQSSQTSPHLIVRESAARARARARARA